MDEKTMQTQRLARLAEKLTGPGALAYALKSDGTLVVVDRDGKKHSFAREAYVGLLTKTGPSGQAAGGRGR